MRSLWFFSVVLAPLALAAPGDIVEPRPRRSVSEHEAAHLPDPVEDPGFSRRLACSACRTMVMELYEHFLEDTPLKYGKKVGLADAIEVMDEVCLKVPRDYGLLLRSNMPTEELSKNDLITRATGGYILHTLTNTCGKIQDLYEESFGMLVFRKHKLADIQKDICENGVRACVPGFYPKHEEHLDPARDAKKDDL